MMTRKEAAQYLGISLSTLDRAREDRKIAFIQYTPGGAVLFEEKDVADYMERYRQAADRSDRLYTFRRKR